MYNLLMSKILNNQIAKNCYIFENPEHIKITHYWKNEIIAPIIILISLAFYFLYNLFNYGFKYDQTALIVYVAGGITCIIWLCIGCFGRTTLVLNRKHILVIERGFPFLNFGCPTSKLNSFKIEGKETDNSDLPEKIYVVLNYDNIYQKRLFKFSSDKDAENICEKLNSFLVWLK